MKIFILLAVGSLLFVAPPAYADGFYKWVDNKGREFFTNDPRKIPPEYRDTAKPVETHDERVTVGGPRTGAVKSSTPSSDHKDKYGRGEKYWRKEAGKLRSKLQDQQDEHAWVLKQLEDQGKGAGKSNSKRKKTTAGLEKKKLKLEKDIEQTRRKLEHDLPEEARRADAYPGWIRE